MSNPRWTCQTCGALLSECGPPDGAEPCPSCGSLARRIEMEFLAEVTHSVALEGKAKSPVGERRGLSNRRVFLEWKQGECPSQATPEGFVDLYRMADRANDRYKERVVAPDGTVLRDVEHPLSEHRGHGSAKTRSDKASSPSPTASESSADTNGGEAVEA